MSKDSQITPPPKEPWQRKLSVTTAQQIVTAVLAGAAMSYLVLLGFDAAAQVPPTVPWSLPILLGCAGLVVFWYARIIQGRKENRMLLPDEGVRAMVLGKSTLMTGCILAGGHLVYAMKWIARIDVPGPRDRVLHGGVTIVAAVLFALAGAFLERACVVDAGDHDRSKGDGQPA